MSIGFKNEIDKIRIVMPPEDYELFADDMGYSKHISCKITQSEGLIITCSGKIAATPYYLGGLTQDNIGVLAEELKSIGILTSEYALRKAHLTCLDVKKDVHTGENISHIIPFLRERAYKSTLKTEVLSYDDVGFENGLIVKSTCKTVKDSLCCYAKMPELKVHRRNDLEYFESFAPEYFDSLHDVVRFERRINYAQNLRGPLRIEKSQTVTLEHVLSCPYDLVGEKVNEIFCI